MIIGPFVNALAIILGGSIGLAFGSRLAENIRSIVFQALGLSVLVIGIKMALATEHSLILIFSVLLGSILGEIMRIELYLTSFGEWLRLRLKSKNPRFTEGIVTSSVLFCIGAMSILGSFDEGLRLDRTIVFSKSILDGFASMALASAMGLGVLFSAIPVLIFQGVLTLFASSMQPWLNPATMIELTATGGTLVIGIALNLLNITKIPLSNMLPALFMVVILSIIFI